MTGKPLCFVIMGFGKKTDTESGKTLDLDKTYLNVIKPAAETAGFRCIRADEINDSGLIDKSMYALLIRAELVVADISTYNPNAIYELGVRHAARPRSTIIIKEESGKIPFDLDHTRIFSYKHLGDDIGVDEAGRCVTELSTKMRAILEVTASDSPLYEYLPSAQPPQMSDEEFEHILGDLAARENSIFSLSESASNDMAQGKFGQATVKWQKAAVISDGEPYFIQQAALSRYKSEEPSKVVACTDALTIINEIDPDNSNDPETLGITGAIYKNLYLATGDLKSLDRSIDFYRRGFVVVNDYYTGENYANCLDLKNDVEKDKDEGTYLKIESRKTRQAIVEMLQAMEVEEIEVRNDALWIHASLSNCLLALDDPVKAAESEERFLALAGAQWHIDTFNITKESIIKRKLQDG